MQNAPLFIDGIGNISLSDSVVRIDLIGLTQGEGNKPVPVKIGSNVMTLPGFLRTVDQMNQMVNKMIEQGVLKRNDPASTPAKPAIDNKA
jgi:hypothetical protein